MSNDEGWPRNLVIQSKFYNVAIIIVLVCGNVRIYTYIHNFSVASYVITVCLELKLFKNVFFLALIDNHFETQKIVKEWCVACGMYVHI